jgi:hypothetical protein
MSTAHYLRVPGPSEMVQLPLGERQITFALVSHENQSRLRF